MAIASLWALSWIKITLSDMADLKNKGILTAKYGQGISQHP